jgi:signal transduction histidine kinase
LVLFNLLKNAYHAIRIAGKGDINISLIKGKTSNFLQFTDTATGIERNVLPHIFDDFFTTKPGGGGAGIGLAFCKRTINSFGGDIRCESIENAYTTFYLRLPVPTDANLVGTVG